MQRVVDAMKLATSRLGNNPVSMTFEGTGRFDNPNSSVVYAAMTKGGDTIKNLRANLQQELQSSCFDISEGKKFHPHLTLLAKRWTKDEDKIKITEDLYKDVADIAFGTQVSTCLQLLSMSEIGSDGYYKVLGSIPFTDLVTDESADHSQCCNDAIFNLFSHENEVKESR